MKHITFYFDFISPYAALAFEQLPESLMGLSYGVTYKPILFAALLKHHGQLGPAEIMPKRDWTYRHVQWLAHRMGQEFQLPAAHPFNPLSLLRLAIASSKQGTPNRYVTETLFRHVWRGGADAVDAGRHLGETSALDPANAIILLFRARLHIFRGEFQKAVNDLRTAVGLANSEALKGFAYFVLSRLYDEEAADAQAARYLALARKHEPNALYLSRAEATQKLERQDVSGLLTEGADWPWLPAALPLARRVAIDSLHPRAFTHGFFGRTTVWVLEPAGGWRCGAVLSHINLESRDQTIEQIVLPVVPTSPFVDSRGNLLRFDCHTIAEPSSGVLVTIRLNPVLKPSEAELIGFDLGNGLPPVTPEGAYELSLRPANCGTSRHHALVLVFPSTRGAPICLPPPDETSVGASTTTFVWYRHAFAGEQLAVQVCFPDHKG